MRTFLTPLLLCSQALLSTAQATGLNFWETSTTNSSLASANGAIANDASVLALVPSSMGQLSQATITASVTYYEVSTDYNIFGNKAQYSTKNPIPMGFFVTPIDENISFGLSIYSRTAADINVPKIPLVHPKETRVAPLTVSVSPSLSYKIGDISFAGTLEYIYAPYALEQTSCILSNCVTSSLEDNTAGWSGALSGTWAINSLISVALTHRFSSHFSDENIDFDLPAITSLYASFLLTNDITWHNTYSYSQWNDKGITYNDYNDPIGLLKGFQNSQRLASSLEYRIGQWSLRGGISLDEAVDQFGGIDSRYRLGMAYDFSDQLAVTIAGITENYAKKQAEIEGNTLVEVQNKGNAISIGASYQF